MVATIACAAALHVQMHAPVQEHMQQPSSHSDAATRDSLKAFLRKTRHGVQLNNLAYGLRERLILPHDAAELDSASLKSKVCSTPPPATPTLTLHLHGCQCTVQLDIRRTASMHAFATSLLPAARRANLHLRPLPFAHTEKLYLAGSAWFNTCLLVREFGRADTGLSSTRVRIVKACAGFRQPGGRTPLTSITWSAANWYRRMPGCAAARSRWNVRRSAGAPSALPRSHAVFSYLLLLCVLPTSFWHLQRLDETVSLV